jgi:dTDP-glucose 4,6-dehydratase
MLLNASEGRPLPIYGDGRNERDWLYVRDHCEALLCALERGRPGEIYNVGGGESLANLALVERLCALLERERPARENPALRARGLSAYAELIRFVEDRPGHDRRYALDAGRARRELGWTPRHAFDAALAETVRWYLARPEWCALHDRRRLGRAAAEARP